MDPRIVAILDRDNPEPFETLISELMMPSKEQRSQAVSLFNLCKEKYPRTLVTKLGNLLESPRFEVRAMSAILLRNLFKQTDPNTLVQDKLPLWNSLHDSTKSLIKSGLLNCVVNEHNKWVISKLSDTISVLAANIISDNDWPELMPFMFDRVASEDFWLQESALLIFTRLAQYASRSLVAYITELLMVFGTCLGNGGSADVKIAALSAVTMFIRCLESSSDKDKFQDLLPGMMQCLTKALNDGNEAMAQKALVLLIELAETEPMFFTGQLVELVGSMLQIAEAESFEKGTRHLTIEFVITLVEDRGQASRIMSKLPQFISRLLAILMRMLLDIEDEAAWHSAENDEDEDADESSNYSVGKVFLDRLAGALGGDTIVPVACEQMRAYLAAPNPEWQKHLAPLVALAQIAKGRSKLGIPNLEQVVTMVLNSFQDPHPRVRWAAINAIGKLSTYVGPSLQDQYHDRVLPALYLALDDVQNPRVQAHAFSTVLYFGSHCKPHILTPYLDEILNKLIVVPMTDPNIQVLKLANSLEESTDDGIRDRLAIQLGEMFKEPLAVLTVYLVQPKLLRCVEKEHNRFVMKSLCHTIAMFYNALCVKTGWRKLIYFLIWCLNGDDLLKEAAMLILGPLQLFLAEDIMYHRRDAYIVYDLYHHSLREYHACLENEDSADIRIAAFGAAIGYIRCALRVKDESLVSAMTRVLTEGLNKGEEVTTQEALKLLIEWTHEIKHPRISELLSKLNDSKSSNTELYDLEFYDTEAFGTIHRRHLEEYFSGRQLVEFVSGAIEIAESQSLGKETRYLAIEFVITLVEGRHSDGEHMINMLFGILISDINEAASHWAENEDDDAGESSNFSILLNFLDRLAFRLDKYYVAWKLEQYLGAPEWRKRVIAIKILARISKVYLKVTKKNFDQLVTMVVALFKDAHPRVRLASINAAGQLSNDLDQDLELQYNSLVLPALSKAICDLDYPQVQAHAASAMINISNKNCQPNILIRYLHETVSILLECRSRTRILAIKNLLKQLRGKLPPDTWNSTFSSLRHDQKAELLSILTY